MGTAMTDIRIGMIGYGEVGRIFSAGLKNKPGVGAVAAWDIKFADPGAVSAQMTAAGDAGIVRATGVAQVCEAATLVISAVTASGTLEAAEAAARHIRPGTFFLDLNSASPSAKRQAGGGCGDRSRWRTIRGSRRHDLGAALRHPSAHVAGWSQRRSSGLTLRSWGMDATVVEADIGVASAIKMCHSIMIKGMEALVIES
jgi:3-hydroxyisobutyrate dehydrogenase-like beta-hydroxyacid dehydrogenase